MIFKKSVLNILKWRTWTPLIVISNGFNECWMSCDWFSCNIIPLVNQNLSKQWKWTMFGYHLVAKDYQSLASFTCENTAMPNQILCLPATNSYFLFHKHHYQEFQMQWAIAIGKEYLMGHSLRFQLVEKKLKCKTPQQQLCQVIPIVNSRQLNHYYWL